MKSAEEIAQDIRNFLALHEEISLHPGRSPLAQGELVVKKGGCPCVPGRPKCPCEEAMDDIEEINHCRCFLFVNDAYLEEYQRVVVEGRKKKKRRQGGVGKSSAAVATGGGDGSAAVGAGGNGVAAVDTGAGAGDAVDSED